MQLESLRVHASTVPNAGLATAPVAGRASRGSVVPPCEHRARAAGLHRDRLRDRQLLGGERVLGRAREGARRPASSTARDGSSSRRSVTTTSPSGTPASTASWRRMSIERAALERAAGRHRRVRRRRRARRPQRRLRHGRHRRGVRRELHRDARRTPTCAACRSRARPTTSTRYRLPVAAMAAGFEDFKHHDAIADAEACAAIVVHAAAATRRRDVVDLAELGDPRSVASASRRRSPSRRPSSRRRSVLVTAAARSAPSRTAAAGWAIPGSTWRLATRSAGSPG